LDTPTLGQTLEDSPINTSYILPFDAGYAGVDFFSVIGLE